MRTTSQAALADQLTALAGEHPTGLVAFDGDGTLWTGDVGDDLLHAFIEQGLFRGPAIAWIQAEASRFGVPTDGPPSAVARGISEGYTKGIIPEDVLFKMVARSVAGHGEAELQLLMRELLARAGLSRRLQPEVTRTLEHCRSLGLEVFVVSASPQSVVEAAVAPLGVEPDHVLAMRVSFQEGFATTTLIEPTPYGPGKAEALAHRAPSRTLVAAFGDSAFDVPMLAAAKVGVAVRPRSRLRARIAEDQLPFVELLPD